MSPAGFETHTDGYTPMRPGGNPYASGAYFANPQRHAEDAEFKANAFLALLHNYPSLDIQSYADVGCGSGATTIAVVESMRRAGRELSRAAGFDVSPHVQALTHPFIRFCHEDFTAGRDCFDLVTLFDVVEHVPDPVGFLKRVAERAKWLGLHVPLDASINLGLRNLYNRQLRDPGHLLVLDTAAALNLLAMADLRVIDYNYTMAFSAPSGRATMLGKLAYPFRALVAAVSPWLLAKTLGGASLMVLALTPRGIAEGGTVNDHQC